MEKGLSPRQKMINLMYLFLTAMLALNVSAEILKAFVVIDTSIRKSTQSINDKNSLVYSYFQTAYKENPKKVEKWYNLANQLKEKTAALDTVIQQYKVKLVKSADGPDGNVLNVNKKDDNNAGGTIMIVEKGGIDLKGKFDEYKNFLLSLIPDSAKQSTSKVLVSNITSTLSTDPVESDNEKGAKVPWEVANFEHLPLIAVIAIMSKMQNDIHNLEADMLNFLREQVDIGAWKFNKLEAIVDAPNSYVKVGEEYYANIFIAAYDTTQAIKVVMSNGSQLPVENGKGVFKPGTGSPGKFDINGKIALKSPSGDSVFFPFTSSYQVVTPTWAISPTKMNVLYIGVDNPVAVTATGRDITASISGSGGKLIPTGAGKYNVRVTSTGKATISVIADGKTAGSMEFRCYPVPDPFATVLGSRGGTVNKSDLLAASFVKAQLDNFVFDLTFPVIGFDVTVTVGAYSQTVSSDGPYISPAQKNLIQQATRGGKVYFENIRAKAPDGSTRQLGTLSFKVN